MLRNLDVRTIRSFTRSLHLVATTALVVAMGAPIPAAAEGVLDRDAGDRIEDRQDRREDRRDRRGDNRDDRQDSREDRRDDRQEDRDDRQDDS